MSFNLELGQQTVSENVRNAEITDDSMEVESPDFQTQTDYPVQSDLLINEQAQEIPSTESPALPQTVSSTERETSSPSTQISTFPTLSAQSTGLKPRLDQPQPPSNAPILSKNLQSPPPSEPQSRDETSQVTTDSEMGGTFLLSKAYDV